jgi:2-keto-4-pentenoate hydratase/2-oxohepta-3-ene-1,7-dioic acid hydratase in catechol pathway
MRLGVLKTGPVVAIEDDRVYEVAVADLRAALVATPQPGKLLGRTADVDFAAPYAPGAKIVCHVVNYRAHATGVGPPSQPYFFTKPSTAVVDPGTPIQPHAHISKELDWETELALVFGREARDVPAVDAYEYIAGFTIVNDVSHREYQFNKFAPDLRQRYGMNWTQGKGLDGSCPIGPWIVLRDELPDPYPLRIRTWVNGELRQDASTADMVHKIPALVAEITRGMTFQPGDIIATGTPDGTAMDSEATPYLQPGDVVRCEIEGIGILENPVGALSREGVVVR